MGTCCDLEVDINGEETFIVNKNILSSFSCKFSNLFGNYLDTNVCLKVIFNDFPGGAYVFELIVQLCYNNNSKKEIVTPSNVALLCSAANFLEMECDAIENFLDGFSLWTWYELIEALKQCQGLLFSTKYIPILDRIVDQLIEKLVLSSATSPYTCSSNTSSNNSLRNSCSGETWWFEHLLFLKIDLMDKVIRRMIYHNFDNGIVSKFLFYYHKCTCFGDAQAEKNEITKFVIHLLSLLDKRSISCKDLFNLNRIVITSKTNTYCKSMIESLIGPLLDKATIDYLLLPPPHGHDHAYDVDFVLRLMHIFFFEASFELTSDRLKRVVIMMDLFLVEVAPDPYLKPSKFEALITVLPDSARESHDQLYIAMNMYLKVHAGLGKKEKMSICCTLNNEKLSADFLRHLNRNLAFPSETKPTFQVNRQSRMKNLLEENDHLKSYFDTMFLKTFKNLDHVKENDDK
ncbi:putative SKP1/BTB/POZ domain, NPH3 domain-containing protein [Lupinus albus]|uniref:Putative SKP1/BTB/POZ domain, NPH3 domain-containing protein n=1 Tax=Lupinus albus TaxID=3870 RepID=A0A6A4NLY1_LUPAL|nr:putative SKP1/BTB/POZ domain, NPH3 domain-containing protein [Lupinus albus]